MASHDGERPDSVSAVEGLAAAALEQYALGDSNRQLIRHNENGAFAITDRQNNRRFLLRVHEPISANLRGIQHTFEGLSSEVAILEACRRSTGLPLQQPVANLAGRPITTANDPISGSSALCTLLTWIEGELLDQADPAAAESIYALGHTVCSMHRWSRKWQPEFRLVRPVYDVAKYWHFIDRIGLGLAHGVLTAADLAAIGRTMQVVAEVLAGYPPTDRTWGLIHADIKPNNVVMADGRPVPIDFCFAGYGYYLVDVGGVLASLRSHLRQSYVDGYQYAAGHRFTSSEWRLIDAFFVLSILGAIGFSVSNHAAHEWLARRMPEWIASYFLPFQKGAAVALAE